MTRRVQAAPPMPPAQAGGAANEPFTKEQLGGMHGDDLKEALRARKVPLMITIDGKKGCGQGRDAMIERYVASSNPVSYKVTPTKEYKPMEHDVKSMSFGPRLGTYRYANGLIFKTVMNQGNVIWWSTRTRARRRCSRR